MEKKDESQTMYYQEQTKEHNIYGFKKMHEYDFEYKTIEHDTRELVK